MYITLCSICITHNGVLKIYIICIRSTAIKFEYKILIEVLKKVVVILYSVFSNNPKIKLYK